MKKIYLVHDRGFYIDRPHEATRHVVVIAEDAQEARRLAAAEFSIFDLALTVEQIGTATVAPATAGVVRPRILPSPYDADGELIKAAGN